MEKQLTDLAPVSGFMDCVSILLWINKRNIILLLPSFMPQPQPHNAEGKVEQQTWQNCESVSAHFCCSVMDCLRLAALWLSYMWLLAEWAFVSNEQEAHMFLPLSAERLIYCCHNTMHHLAGLIMLADSHYLNVKIARCCSKRDSEPQNKHMLAPLLLRPAWAAPKQLSFCHPNEKLLPRVTPSPRSLLIQLSWFPFGLRNIRLCECPSLHYWLGTHIPSPPLGIVPLGIRIRAINNALTLRGILFCWLPT